LNALCQDGEEQGEVITNLNNDLASIDTEMKKLKSEIKAKNDSIASLEENLMQSVS
jgi:hypothetical protein